MNRIAPPVVLAALAALVASGCGDPTKLLDRVEPQSIKYVRKVTRQPAPPPPGAGGGGFVSPQAVQTVLADHQRRMSQLQRQAMAGADPGPGVPAFNPADMEVEVARTLDQLRGELPPAQQALFDDALRQARAEAERLKAQAEAKQRQALELQRQADERRRATVQDASTK